MTETNMISGVSQSGISSANGTMMPTPGMGQQGQYLNFFTVLVLASKLPQFPLPTHNVVVRGHSPLEFEIFVQHIKTLLSGLKLCTSFRIKGAS